MLLVKYDGTTNEVLWTRLWGYFYSEYATALTVDPAGNILVTGNTTSLDPALNTDIILLTWDTGGGLLAARGWGRPGLDDTAAAVAADAGGVTIGGAVDLAGNLEGLVLRLDGSGNQLWARTWGDAATDTVTAVLTGTAGAVVAAGVLDSGGAAARGLLIDFDATGTVQWDRAWTVLPSHLGGLDLAGGLLVVGGGAPAAAGGWQSGVISPQASADYSLVVEGYEVNIPTGSFLVPTGEGLDPTGFIEDTGGGGADGLLIRYNPGSTI